MWDCFCRVRNPQTCACHFCLGLMVLGGRCLILLIQLFITFMCNGATCVQLLETIPLPCLMRGLYTLEAFPPIAIAIWVGCL